MKKFKNVIKDLFSVYTHEFYIVFHDFGLILFFAFLPLAYPIIYSLIYNPEVVRDVRMVVVDHDRSSVSRDLVRKLDACQEVKIIGYAADLPEGRRAMNSHKCYAILEIPEGFGKKVGDGQQANAAMYCEMSLLLRYKGFLVASTNVMLDMGQELLTHKIDAVAPLAETVVSGDLLPIHNIAMGNIESGFDSFIMPGVLILILHQCIILACGMAGGARRENPRKIGYIPYNEGKSVLVAMIAKSLCYITLLLFPILYLVHYVPLMFSFPMAGNAFEIVAFLLPMVIACLGLGYCLQAVTWERESVFVLWVVTSVIFLFISGLTWPRFAMPRFWQWVGDLIPATWGVEGFIRMNTNGATIWQVRHCYYSLWILAAVYWIAGYCIQRWVVRPQAMRCRSRYLAGNEQSGNLATPGDTSVSDNPAPVAD